MTDLHLVPCECVWLEVAVQESKIVAICKWCKRKEMFVLTEWETLLYEGKAINKPIRI